jgi:hypothetical protein
VAAAGAHRADTLSSLLQCQRKEKNSLKLIPYLQANHFCIILVGQSRSPLDVRAMTMEM